MRNRGNTTVSLPRPHPRRRMPISRLIEPFAAPAAWRSVAYLRIIAVVSALAFSAPKAGLACVSILVFTSFRVL